MPNTDFITHLLAPYQPQLPVEQLVLEVNKLYHAAEAQDYDERHPEVHQQLPPIWQAMVEQIATPSESKVWRILNFGCGTGFEAEQLIRNLPIEKITKLTCYDPSPEMLARCQSKIGSLLPTASFISELKDHSIDEPYNLLITNSLLHHLPDPLATIDRLLPLLTPDCMWIAGHEPSSRFYKNTECLQLYNRFLQERKWKKFLSLDRYFERLRQVIGLESDPARQAAQAAFHRGLFKQPPSAAVVGRLVDFHVAHSLEEATVGRGFDFEIMQQDADSWQLIWVKTYAFMGNFYEEDLPLKWADLSRKIANNFPKDGANFCMVWRRCS